MCIDFSVLIIGSGCCMLYFNCWRTE